GSGCALRQPPSLSGTAFGEGSWQTLFVRIRLALGWFFLDDRLAPVQRFVTVPGRPGAFHSSPRDGRFEKIRGRWLVIFVLDDRRSDEDNQVGFLPRLGFMLEGMPNQRNVAEARDLDITVAHVGLRPAA